MIVVLVIVLTLSWLEQEITGNHLEDGACERPDISRSVVIGSNDDLWGSILSSLNFWRKVVVSPATITHVANLDHDFLVDLSASLVVELVEHLFLLSLFGLIVFFFQRIKVVWRWWYWASIFLLLDVDLLFLIVD